MLCLFQSTKTVLSVSLPLNIEVSSCRREIPPYLWLVVIFFFFLMLWSNLFHRQLFNDTVKSAFLSCVNCFWYVMFEYACKSFVYLPIPTSLCCWTKCILFYLLGLSIRTMVHFIVCSHALARIKYTPEMCIQDLVRKCVVTQMAHCQNTYNCTNYLRKNDFM